MRDRVIIEPLEHNWIEVAVLYYDDIQDVVTDEVMEVTSRGNAELNYDVIGEKRDGKVRFYDEDVFSDYDTDDVLKDMGLDEEWYED